MDNIDKHVEKEYQIYVENFNRYYDDKSEANYLTVKESENKLKAFYASKFNCEVTDETDFIIGFASFLGKLNSKFE